VDENGFTWDLGGHIKFSHYSYFDDLMRQLLGSEWLRHERESWIRILDTFVPYPFQRNIHRLPREQMRECLRGLIQAAGNHGQPRPATFAEWIRMTFGAGIARLFLEPYNRKVWAYDPAELGCGWMGERVSQVDLERVVFSILDQSDDVSWGPNDTFEFPMRGGTGEIWRRLAASLPAGSITYNRWVSFVDTTRKTVRFDDGSEAGYDALISTMPLDQFLLCSDLEHLRPAAGRFLHSATHVIGVGLEGTPPPELKTKCWMYFPEDNCPFYRATVFSNYSPNNVPDAARYWSLMLEVSESAKKTLDRSAVVESVISGLLATHLIDSRKHIVSVWHRVAEYGYPTPFLGRDELIGPIQTELERRQIYSRGRFGAWKYEVSNQDHSLMQGVEVASRLLLGAPEITLTHPEIING
jgi:protoporphyrinogen oxidase